MTGQAFKARLAERLRFHGVASLSGAQEDALWAYFSILSQWNHRINLTGFDLLDPTDAAFDRLLTEPIFAARCLTRQPRRMIDIGSGGGSPGIPVAIITGVTETVLVESRSRKAVFLKEALRASGIPASEVVTRRFQELPTEPQFFERFDLVTLRAVKLNLRDWEAIAMFLGPTGVFLHLGEAGANPTGHALELENTWKCGTIGPVTAYRR